jgi:phage protein D
MSDLITSATKTFDNLLKEYGNFRVPSFKLVIDNNPFELFTENLNITLATNTASSLSFNLSGGYDLAKHTFKWDSIALGAKVSASIGYGSNLKTVFTGFINNINYEYNDNPAISVTCLDAVTLMQTGTTRAVTHTAKSCAEILRNIMKNYSLICKEGDIDSSAKFQNNIELQQTSNDYNFIKNDLTAVENAEQIFFICNDKYYFVKPDKYSSPITTLEWGRSVLNLSLGYRFADLKIQGVGEKDTDRSEVTGKTISNQKSVTSSPVTEFMQFPELNSSEKVASKIKACMNEKLSQCKTANAVCIGLPEIVPNRYIKFSGFGNNIDGLSLRINRVTHNIGINGFKTSFDVVGFK